MHFQTLSLRNSFLPKSTTPPFRIKAQIQRNEGSEPMDGTSVNEDQKTQFQRPLRSPPRSSGRRKLKKSKTMQAFAAALAAKTRETQTSSDLKNILEGPTYDTESSNGDFEFQDIPESALHLPYDSFEQEQFENDPNDFCVLPKPIYIVSDCTGYSAARTVRAALNQFESSIQTHCPATLLIYRFVSEKTKIQQIIQDAAKEDALVVFTLVDPELVAALRESCAYYEVKAVDLWSNLLDLMEQHLETMRSIIPMNHPSRKTKRALDADYFTRIEAVEFTRKMDDGNHPEKWKEADLLLLGVSRSGKTPLSIYLGQRGYKVANLPLIPNCPIPKELYEMDPSKVFCLIIDPKHLMKIRESRMGAMGVKDKGSSMYAELKGVVEELEFAQKLYKRNPMWPVLDVTCMGVEESAASILRILTERSGQNTPVVYYASN